jgi:two-component system LytT family response regulator
MSDASSTPPTMMLSVLIAEDEPVPRRRLARLLGQEPDVHVVAQCAGGREAVQRIREESPDVVFLDVQMPDLDGFRVIEEIGVDRMPTVVFVTAYNEYAVRAFEVHAVDYLLKPYDEARFHTALERARERVRGADRAPSSEEDRLRALLREFIADAGGSARRAAAFEHIAVRVDGAIRVIPIDDVDWFEAEGNYVRVHVARVSHLLRQTISGLEEQLDPRRFVRIHRRHLVNLARVHEVQPWFGGDAVVVLRDGRKLRLSRTYREQFHARLLGERTVPEKT